MTPTTSKKRKRRSKTGGTQSSLQRPRNFPKVNMQIPKKNCTVCIPTARHRAVQPQTVGATAHWPEHFPRPVPSLYQQSEWAADVMPNRDTAVLISPSREKERQSMIDNFAKRRRLRLLVEACRLSYTGDRRRTLCRPWLNFYALPCLRRRILGFLRLFSGIPRSC